MGDPGPPGLMGNPGSKVCKKYLCRINIVTPDFVVCCV